MQKRERIRRKLRRTGDDFFSRMVAGRKVDCLLNAARPKAFPIRDEAHRGITSFRRRREVLTISLDRMATDPRFAPDGKSVYFIADDDGTKCLPGQSGGRQNFTSRSGRFILYAYSVRIRRHCGADSNRRPP